MLHSTDAATVFLSVHARTNGVDAGRHRARAVRGAHARPHARHAPDAVRRAARARPRRRGGRHARDRRPRAQATRADDRRERALEAARRLAPACDGDRAARARGARRGVHVRPHEVRPGPGEASPVRDRRHEVGDHAERRLADPPAARDGAEGRPRPAAHHLGQRPVPLGPDGRLARRRDRADGDRRLRRRCSSSAGSRPSGRRPRPTCAGGPGWTARETRAALAAIPHAEVDLDGATGYVLADDLEPTEPLGALGGAPPGARPDDDGLEGARRGTSARTSAPSSTAPAMPGRPSGGRAASSAAGRSAGTGRSRSGCSRTSARRPSPRSRRRQRARKRGSGTRASRRASSRRSSARSAVPSRLAAGRSPSRSRAAGSATCPRRSGTASRRA